mgnify:CR=1 FL=1
MSELKGNFKAAYDVVKRAERCVLLRRKAANPSHTYAVGDVDSNGLVFGLVLKTDPEAAVRASSAHGLSRVGRPGIHPRLDTPYGT